MVTPRINHTPGTTRNTRSRSPVSRPTGARRRPRSQEPTTQRVLRTFRASAKPAPPAVAVAGTAATQLDGVLARYREMAAGSDSDLRRLAEAQLNRLARFHRSAIHGVNADTSAPRTSRWAHVPIADLFHAAGNAAYERANGKIETGHEPLHSSKSGRCVVIEPEAGLWWCRSCRHGGDAAAFVMALHGWPYPRASVWLKERYGLPRKERRRG